MANFSGRIALHVAHRNAEVGMDLATPPLALPTFALRT